MRIANAPRIKYLCTKYRNTVQLYIARGQSEPPNIDWITNNRVPPNLPSLQIRRHIQYTGMYIVRKLFSRLTKKYIYDTIKTNSGKFDTIHRKNSE